jgi:4-carboxymuconolactone decarboxylase
VGCESIPVGARLAGEGALKYAFAGKPAPTQVGVCQEIIEMSNEKYEKGLKIRTQVLGEAYVNRSIENADDFTRPLQEMVTEYCWGHVWGREGLSLKERSMINLAMISALNRPHELKLHVRGALRNGLSREQIREILLQVGIYCGVPAAVDSFRLAREAFAEADAEASS